MNLKKSSLLLVIILAIYLLGFNYQLLSHFFDKTLRTGTVGPTGIQNSEIQAGGLSTNNIQRKFYDYTRVEIKADVRGGRNEKKTKLLHSSQRISLAYDTFESMISDDKHASYSRDYPENSTCRYVGLRKPYTKSTVAEISQEPKCRLRLKTPNDCKESRKYYGKPGEIKEVKCNISKVIEMCRILRLGNVNSFDVVCDARYCKGKPFLLGLLGKETGMVSNWTVILDIRNLGQHLRDHAASSKFGGSFALLKCDKSDILQVLTIPRTLESPKATQRRKKINFNVIVEDSVSRPHFYRTLSKTVSTLRNIIYNQSIPATLLEFEKFQSYGSTTKLNLQRFFSGTKYSDANSDEIGVENFYSQLKDVGYNTLFQEDNCWFDFWGTLLDMVYKRGHVRDTREAEKIWRKHIKLLEQTKRIDSIDDFGVSFLSCSVYSTFRATNVYDSKRFPNICFAGKHFSSFLLNYVKEYMKLNDNATKPFLAYTHVVTSHERSGRRIVNDDATLSKLLQQAAYLRNTVTIFLSDHGGKSTKFSTYTAQGRREVFQPFLFMILPHEVSNRLGSKVMNSLVVNQNRLVGLEDLGDALRSYTEPKASELRGLFRPIPLNRTCEQFHLDSDVLCLCDKMDKSVSNVSQEVKWAAEFALGSLNNRIQDQFVAGLKSKYAGKITSDFYGYGACQRYIGFYIGLVRQLVAGEQETLAFTLFTQPFDRKTQEAFEVKVSFPVKREKGMTLDKFTRVSSFNEYEQCADKSVDPKLCTCRTSPQKSFKWRKRFMKRATTLRSFSLRPKGLLLDKPCLTIMSRNRHYVLSNNIRQNASSTYEAFNACADVTYDLTVSIKKAKHSRASRNLPFTVKIFPRTIIFLMTVRNEWKFGRFVPRFSFVKKKLRVRNGLH